MPPARAAPPRAPPPSRRRAVLPGRSSRGGWRSRPPGVPGVPGVPAPVPRTIASVAWTRAGRGRRTAAAVARGRARDRRCWSEGGGASGVASGGGGFANDTARARVEGGFRSLSLRGEGGRTRGGGRRDATRGRGFGASVVSVRRTDGARRIESVETRGEIKAADRVHDAPRGPARWARFSRERRGFGDATRFGTRRGLGRGSWRSAYLVLRVFRALRALLRGRPRAVLSGARLRRSRRLGASVSVVRRARREKKRVGPTAPDPAPPAALDRALVALATHLRPRRGLARLRPGPHGRGRPRESRSARAARTDAPPGQPGGAPLGVVRVRRKPPLPSEFLRLPATKRDDVPRCTLNAVEPGRPSTARTSAPSTVRVRRRATRAGFRKSASGNTFPPMKRSPTEGIDG